MDIKTLCESANSSDAHDITDGTAAGSAEQRSENVPGLDGGLELNQSRHVSQTHSIIESGDIDDAALPFVKASADNGHIPTTTAQQPTAIITTADTGADGSDVMAQSSSNANTSTTTGKTNSRRGREGNKPKLFQCTGYGDCRMVFTRSEHLARHARKHTGEKPFQCIVPNCNRMFSRFDNMMQHTQTHRHRGGKPYVPGYAAKKGSKQSTLASPKSPTASGVGSMGGRSRNASITGYNAASAMGSGNIPWNPSADWQSRLPLSPTTPNTPAEKFYGMQNQQASAYMPVHRSSLAHQQASAAQQLQMQQMHFQQLQNQSSNAGQQSGGGSGSMQRPSYLGNNMLPDYTYSLGFSGPEWNPASTIPAPSLLDHNTHPLSHHSVASAGMGGGSGEVLTADELEALQGFRQFASS